MTDGVKKFALPMFGGFDGVDVSQVDPFSNVNVLDVSGRDDTTHYANYSIKKAIDSVSDSEVVAYDVISIPGLTNTVLSNQLIAAVEDRGDALAIIDLDDQYKETYENAGTRAGGGIDDVKTTARTRDLNTSYAATYYPRVRVRDTLSNGNDVFIAPASVAAIGALASLMLIQKDHGSHLPDLIAAESPSLVEMTDLVLLELGKTFQSQTEMNYMN